MKTRVEQKLNRASHSNTNARTQVRRFNAKLSAANAVFEQQTSCLRELLKDSRNEIRNVVAEPSSQQQRKKEELIVTPQNVDENHRKQKSRPPQSIDEALALLVP